MSEQVEITVETIRKTGGHVVVEWDDGEDRIAEAVKVPGVFFFELRLRRAIKRVRRNAEALLRVRQEYAGE